MYKKLLAAPLALALSLSAVAPTMVHAEEVGVTATENQVTSEKVNFDLLYKDAVTTKFDSYFGQEEALKVASINVVEGKFVVKMEIAKLLTTFEVDGVQAKVLAEEASSTDRQVVQFTLNHSLNQNAKLLLGYTVGGYNGKHEMELDFTPGYTPVKPTITFANLPTNSYDKQFTNVSYKAVEKGYEIVVDLASVTSLFKVNGDEVEVKQDQVGNKYVEFFVEDIQSAIHFTHGYEAGPYSASHEYTMDLTPSMEEVKAVIVKAVANLSYTTADKITDASTYAAAVKEAGYVMSAKSYKVDDVAVADIDYTNYDAQMAAIQTYKAPILQELTSKLTVLTYVNENTITSTEQLKEAEAQYKVATEAIAVATTAGLDAKKDITTVEGYANVAKQAEQIAAYKQNVVAAASKELAGFTFTKANSINTKAQLATAKQQVTAAQAAITAATAVGFTTAEVEALEGYANITLQQAVIDAGVKQLQTKRTLKVTTTNAKGAADTVKVTGVKKGDTVRLYNAKGKVMTKATATSTTVTFKKVNLGKEAGKVTVTAQAVEQKESAKKAATFKKEAVSAMIKSSSVTVKNNKIKSDVITVKNTVKGEVIYVYNAKGKQIKKVTATGKTTTIKISQLGKKAGYVKIARVQAGKHVSAKTTVKFSKEK